MAQQDGGQDARPLGRGAVLVQMRARRLESGLRAMMRGRPVARTNNPPLSAYRVERGRRGGLLLGYAATAPGQIRMGVRRLATALR